MSPTTMIELTETTIATALAVLGVVGTIVWYALAWYGIRTLQELSDAVDQRSPDGE